MLNKATGRSPMVFQFEPDEIYEADNITSCPFGSTSLISRAAFCVG
jgi:phage-related protein